MDIYRECRTYEEFIQRMEKFAKLNGLHLKYRTDFLDEISYISLASYNLGRNREYRIPWREVTDISDTIKAITDDVCKAFNLRKEKESVNHSVNTTTSSKPTSLPEIKKVIYNDPATVVGKTMKVIAILRNTMVVRTVSIGPLANLTINLNMLWDLIDILKGG